MDSQPTERKDAGWQCWEMRLQERQNKYFPLPLVNLRNCYACPRQLIPECTGPIDIDWVITSLATEVTKGQRMGCRMSYSWYLQILPSVRDLGGLSSLLHLQVIFISQMPQMIKRGNIFILYDFLKMRITRTFMQHVLIKIFKNYIRFEVCFQSRHHIWSPDPVISECKARSKPLA